MPGARNTPASPSERGCVPPRIRSPSKARRVYGRCCPVHRSICSRIGLPCGPTLLGPHPPHSHTLHGHDFSQTFVWLAGSTFLEGRSAECERNGGVGAGISGDLKGAAEADVNCPGGGDPPTVGERRTSLGSGYYIT